MASSILFSFLFLAHTSSFFSIHFHFCEYNPAACMTITRQDILWSPCWQMESMWISMLGQVAYSEVHVTYPQNICRVMMSDVLEISHMQRCSKIHAAGGKAREHKTYSICKIEESRYIGHTGCTLQDVVCLWLCILVQRSYIFWFKCGLRFWF